MDSDELIPHTPLACPLRVTEHHWPDNVRPLVSVICTAYQHVNFIRDAIEGFLMQETTFPIEILIHDDASTDGTGSIIREYAERFPTLIKTTLQQENQYSKGKRPGKLLRGLALGEFLALCEGDDYWTSPLKLHKQINFLKEHPKAPACIHPVDIIDDIGNLLPENWQYWPKDLIETEDLIRSCRVVTCSVVQRSACDLDSVPSLEALPMGDWPMFLRLSLINPLVYLPENMAVYRRHSGGLCSGNIAEVINVWPFLFLTAVLPLLHEENQQIAKECWQLSAIKFIHYLVPVDKPILFEDCRKLIAAVVEERCPIDSLSGSQRVVMESMLDKATIDRTLENANYCWAHGLFAQSKMLYRSVPRINQSRYLRARIYACDFPKLLNLAKKIINFCKVRAR